MPTTGESVELRRTLTLPLMILYGLGTILGAGIYVLTGAVAGRAGMSAPLSFVAASVVAGLTGLCFGELCARFPRSAGEAIYVAKGFGRERLGTLVGVLVLVTGIVSAATLAVGFTGYLQVFVDAPSVVAVIVLMVVMTVVAVRGIAESVLFAAVITLIEVGGLIAVVVVSGSALADFPARAVEMIPVDLAAVSGIAGGAFLAFYAFIGFEDMVNVAEEVQEPERTMPRAIMIAVAIATLLYVVVAAVAVLSLSPDELASSSRPMADIFEANTGRSPAIIGLISLFAVVNGALIQLVMGARIVYGLAQLGWIPMFLGRVSPVTRTPVRATVLVATLVTLLAISVPLTVLAEVTSFVILVVFSMVNASLWLIHAADPDHPQRIAAWIPKVSTIVCVALVVGRGAMLIGIW